MRTVLANKRKHNACNGFSHWLWPFWRDLLSLTKISPRLLFLRIGSTPHMSHPLSLLELPQTISKGTYNAANPLLPNLFENSIRIPINMAFTHLLRSQQNYLVNAQCTHSKVNFIVVSVRFAINDQRRNRPLILYLRLKHGLSIMSHNWYVITHPNHNFKSGWVKPPLVLGHGWVIACHNSMLLTDIMN